MNNDESILNEGTTTVSRVCEPVRGRVKYQHYESGQILGTSPKNTPDRILNKPIIRQILST
jgi:hypothetical protein